MSIVGNIECKGPAQVFGRIKGEVRASDLQIRDGAQVEGSVIAQNVTVCGHVRGTIRAVRVKLQNGGAVEGDIFHRTLSIDETLSLKDRRGALRIQRSHRRASTPKARRNKDLAPAPLPSIDAELTELGGSP
jgi:cytoskeletal protein CcmA (bactofilin family)